MKLIHLTDNKKFKVEPIDIRNSVISKPLGGLWCTPDGVAYGWREHLASMEWECPQEAIQLEIDTSRLCVIDSYDDLDALPLCEYIPGLSDPAIERLLTIFTVPDFKAIKASGVDAIHLTVRGEAATRHSLPKSLYGWDCESVLILNERCLLTPHEIRV